MSWWNLVCFMSRSIEVRCVDGRNKFNIKYQMSANLILVTREDGTAIQNENGDVLVQNTSDGKIDFIKFEIASQIFNIENMDSQMDIAPTTCSPVSHAYKSQSIATESTSSPIMVENIQSDRNHWNRSHILSLIEAYKNHKSQFQSTVMRNDKVWQIISAELGHHTTDQCSNKFKYLKALYIKKKDNMSNKQTGAGRIKFDYFEEFDAIFGNDANVKPVAIASSSKGSENVPLQEIDISNENQSTTDEDCTFDHPKKRKRSLLEKQLMSYESNIAEREKRKEQQHKDKMERQDKATAALTKIADCFAIYVGKKRSNDEKEN